MIESRFRSTDVVGGGKGLAQPAPFGDIERHMPRGTSLQAQDIARNYKHNLCLLPHDCPD
jgi:hypothetical protein